MKFYEMLVEHYDDIFPKNQPTYEFIQEGLLPGDKVLDVACGTGNYTVSLIKEGIKACGLDLEETMIQKADEKAENMGLVPDFVVSSMLDMDLVSDGDLRRIFIIGNSLVHLRSMDEVRAFLKSAYELLADNGDLIIQIINYERILSQKISHLPVIEVPEKQIRFERNYIYDAVSGMIEFSSQLDVGNEHQESSIYLLPIRKDDLLHELTKAGFEGMEIYGSFEKDSFTENSVPLIVKAMKNT